jgi:hypothetical protein
MSGISGFFVGITSKICDEAWACLSRIKPVVLKVDGNEKRGGSGRRQKFSICPASL